MRIRWRNIVKLNFYFIIRAFWYSAMAIRNINRCYALLLLFEEWWNIFWTKGSFFMKTRIMTFWIFLHDFCPFHFIHFIRFLNWFVWDIMCINGWTNVTILYFLNWGNYHWKFPFCNKFSWTLIFKKISCFFRNPIFWFKTGILFWKTKNIALMC